MTSQFGPAYEPVYDRERLLTQMERIRDFMLRESRWGSWMTLSEISYVLGYPEASVSAQLRHLRKRHFGGYIVEKRRRGNRSKGLFEYRVSAPKAKVQEQLPLVS